MGKVYQSVCGCLRSKPEPDPADYEGLRDWGDAHDDWLRQWQAQLREHGVAACLQEQAEREGWDD